jgi:DNA recombination protein RmuC
MDLFILILLILLLSGIIAVIVMLYRNSSGSDRLVSMKDQIEQLSRQNEELRKILDQKLSENYKATQHQVDRTTNVMQNVTDQAQKLMSDIHKQSQNLISNVSEKLTKLDETNKQVVDFSSQLKNLQDILQNPKQRGVLGEYYLEETLKNVLPPNSYAMQYGLGKDKKTGQELIVDAVVFVKDKIIPVDSKFSLENYEKILGAADKEERKRWEREFRQDLKTRIEETAKYIKPEKGTLEFAFMFIPSEAIYYDLLVNKIGVVKTNTLDLIEYAFRDKKVIIVSPTSFLAYLQTVLQGLRAMQIEESAKDIKSNVEKLGNHILSYENFLKKMGNSLGTTVNHYNNAYKEFNKIDKDVVKITGKAHEVEPEALEKPKLEENE